MKLFYKPGACSMASHMVLLEAGATFDLDEVDTAIGQTKSGRDFTQLNPNGYVPALELKTGEVLTEGASILQYIADQFPGSQLAPDVGTVERAKVQQYLNYTSSELHKAFGPLFSDNATESEKADARVNVGKKLDYVATLFSDLREYLVGSNFTVADAYMFVVINWSNFVGVDLSRWPDISAYVERISNRQSAQNAMRTEGLIS